MYIYIHVDIYLHICDYVFIYMLIHMNMLCVCTGGGQWCHLREQAYLFSVYINQYIY